MGRIDLGLSDRDIGSLTCLEYDALINRKRENDNRLRLNAGLIAAAIYNAAPFGDEDRKAVSPLEFVPELKERLAPTPVDMTEMTPEEQRDYLFAVFGKRVIREGK